ncbi:type II toxin-antitoxin system RelE/ParE family toxin [Candidatus Thiothrix anitrata]|jgi:hypothetical protein|uniref:Uncharacterized protein n=1 Tax=Candidatus Thiothrix anitrata TaxID=2823902 RepID=A0ABX7X5Z4_9GAMM|nr:hypothetical protein [Candidatus Thiothrix anitrata]QTR50687.1 hypothetical protein J8380_03715 [Candidatus Thiothrix anitrata]
MSGLVFYHRQNTHPAFNVLQNAIHINGEHQVSREFNEFLIDAYVLADSLTSRVIAIDFDNTITADIDFYLDLIDAYRNQEWEPVVCTLRDAMADNLNEIHEKLHDSGIRIYTTDGKRKRAFMLHQGISVGLWIDDYFPGISQCGTSFLLNNGIDY